MSNLLELVNFDTTVKQTRRGPSSPLLMEFPVNPELAPFLVSSTRAVQWVSHASDTGLVRAAVRKRQNLESEAVAAVVSMGQEAEWGNVHPLTTDGVKRCIDHLLYYEIAPLEILVASDTDMEGIELPQGVRVVDTPWMPLNALAVVPVDRGLLGTMGTIGQHKAVMLIHNASRGMAVAWR